MPSKTVSITGDSYVYSGTATKNYNSSSRLYVGSVNKYLSYLNWINPNPKNTIVDKGILRVYVGEAWAAGITVTVDPIAVATGAKPWSASTIKFTGRPGVRAPSVAIPLGAKSANGYYDLDITPILAAVAAGAPWAGVRLIASGSARKSFHSMSASAAYRPRVIITWSETPSAPTGLTPRSGFAVSGVQPTFNWNFVDKFGDVEMQAYQIQISESPSFATLSYDSGVVLEDTPQHRSAGTTFQAAEGKTYYWRVKNRDKTLWSPWSGTESFRYVPLGTIDITQPFGADPYVEEPTPPLSWTLGAGMVQTAYEVEVFDPETGAKIFETGRITSSDNTVSVPEGAIKTTGKAYLLRVYVWDNVERIDNPGLPSYAQDSVEFDYRQTATVTPPSEVTITPYGVLPLEILGWKRATMPDSFSLMKDGVIVKTDMDPEFYQSSTDPTKYSMWDYNSGRQSHTWEIIAVANGKSSANNPKVTTTLKRKYVWLIANDNTLPVAVLNPDYSLSEREMVQVVEPMDGPPSVQVQEMVGETGTLSGRLSNNEVQGYTAKNFRDNLRNLRKNKGGLCRLFFADEMMQVFFYGLKIQRITLPDGSTEYSFELQFVQV